MDPFEREERREEERGRLKKERRYFKKHQEAVSHIIVETLKVNDLCTDRCWKN